MSRSLVEESGMRFIVDSDKLFRVGRCDLQRVCSELKSLNLLNCTLII